MRPPKKLDTAIAGLVITVLLQAGTFVWSWSDMNSRVQALEREVAPLRAIAETVGRLDERTKALDRIERKLDAMEPGR
jgi:hypothetical protein